jgi:hypothetical protein
MPSRWTNLRKVLLCGSAAALTACGGRTDDAPAPTPVPVVVAVAPSITAHPAAVTVTEAQPATFAVTAAGTAPLAFQWRRGSNDIAGATSATFTLPATTLADNGASFAVVVSNSAGTVTSNAAPLTVNAQSVAPLISAQPSAAAVAVGGTATFSVAAGGTPAPTLQWSIAGGASLADGAGTGPLTGATISGANTPTLTLANLAQSANGLQLVASASNSAGTVESAAVQLSVNALSSGTPISAATGGTASSPDGKARLTFPADAFTADVTVTFTPIEAITLPATEDFASFETIPGSFYRVEFSGGLLKPDVPISVALLRPALAQALRVRRAELPPPNDGGVSVTRCEGQTEVTFPTREPDGYELAQGVQCGTDPGRGLDVGRGRLVPTPSATLFTRAIGVPGDDYLLGTIAHANGRTAFSYNTPLQIGDTSTSGFGLGIVASKGSLARVPQLSRESFPYLLGFDGGGTLLTLTSGCQLAAYRERVSSLLGALIAPTPAWTAKLPTTVNACRTPAVAPTSNGWVVAFDSNLIWYDTRGAEIKRAAVFFVSPTLGTNVLINMTSVLADAQGNIWVAGLEAVGSNGDCAPGPGEGCPVIVKVSAAGEVLVQHILGAELRRGSSSRIALATDSAGAVYAAAGMAGADRVDRINVTRFTADGQRDWSQRLPETWGVEAGAIAVDATGRVYVGTAFGSIGGRGTMPLARGRFVFRLTPAGANDGYVYLPGSAGDERGISTVAGLSVDANGVLTYMGEFNSLDGLTPLPCLPGKLGSCLDLVVKKFNF